MLVLMHLSVNIVDPLLHLLLELLCFDSGDEARLNRLLYYTQSIQANQFKLLLLKVLIFQGLPDLVMTTAVH